ncbi:hypothetical protein PN456_19105 [Nodularia spumigena CS-586/05]|nr:hypothetical protein [Nodularia spumigena CS-586/05]
MYLIIALIIPFTKQLSASSAKYCDRYCMAIAQALLQADRIIKTLNAQLLSH